jgi:hypothetical protein
MHRDLVFIDAAMLLVCDNLPNVSSQLDKHSHVPYMRGIDVGVNIASFVMK